MSDNVTSDLKDLVSKITPENTHSEIYIKPLGQEILPKETEDDFIDWKIVAEESKEKYNKLLSTVQELLNYDLVISNQDLLIMAFGLSPYSPQAKKFLTDRNYQSKSCINISSFTAKKLIKCDVIKHEEKLMKIFNAREECFSNVRISTIKGEPEPVKAELNEDNKELIGAKDVKDESKET